MDKTRILLVEDQALVRGAIAALLRLNPGLEVVAEAEDGEQALQLLAQHPADLVLTDIEMPKLTGLELAETLAKQRPELKLAVMTTFSRAGYIRRALEAGVSAFILKEAPSDYLVEAIAKVMAGQKVIDPELAMLALGDKDPLSDKERKALRLAGEGLANREIASKLCLSEGTVRNYLSEASNKLGASNRVEAARIAQQKGWL
ncbi:MAG: response regulator transcription factor [Cellvibrionaceae bacterium]|nr:response regulator transcription factor [Cellvibrionaceae bacterium]MCV6626643.1 response regulator transcription factor [Cellvibrionaceae bacterium]